ncbi:MAG: hypothetical protein ACLFWM_07335 [Actinomycetota bacterium]
MSGRWGHLTARFFDVITSRPLDRREAEEVAGWVGPGVLRDAFFTQPVADQRHGYEAARHVLSLRPDRPDLVRAALLHDVGKRHSRLGPLGRVAASLALAARLPLTERLALYRDHGALAAAEMAGEAVVVVDFARHHHGERPPSIPSQDWEILQGADRARRPSRRDR